MTIDIEVYEPADIMIYRKDKGLILKEKSLLAYDAVTSKIIGFGTEAEQIAREYQGKAVLSSPLRQGMVADYVLAMKLFTCLINKAWGKKLFRKPSVAISMPKDITEVERKAAMDALYQAGARNILLFDAPADELMKKLPEQLPKIYRKLDIIIDITKADPERYIREQLTHALRYAASERISAERVAELLSSLEMARQY